MENYKTLANEARKRVLEMVHRGGTSHIASNFSVIDITSVLYENLEEGDEVVWSCAWKAATMYYFLAKQGKIPQEDLKKFPNPPYIGLAEPNVPGVWVAGGSMGQGLAVAVGMALGKKLAGESGTIYCILSDGELQEGSTWEAILQAGHDKLDNLVSIIDYNKWCAMGRTNEILNLEPLKEKFEAFNWFAHKGNGHDYEYLERCFTTGNPTGKPLCFIMDTVKGKGVSFFEDHLLYHYKNVEDEEYKLALKELV